MTEDKARAKRYKDNYNLTIDEYNKVGKEMDAMIWKLVKPRGDDQSFRTEGE